MEELKAIWNSLLTRYTKDDVLVEELWVDLVKKYSNKKRPYHNLTHLQYMAAKAGASKPNLTDYDAILFSIFYHDYVYSARRQDNEQKSAVIAREQLGKIGVPETRIANCETLILATKSHQDHQDTDVNYFVDFDLAILGETPENYQTYVKNIRNEYAIYPDFLYNKGRAKVLQHFLDMDNLFKTDEFRNKYEAQARANLRSELQTLTKN